MAFISHSSFFVGATAFMHEGEDSRSRRDDCVGESESDGLIILVRNLSVATSFDSK